MSSTDPRVMQALELARRAHAGKCYGSIAHESYYEGHILKVLNKLEEFISLRHNIRLIGADAVSDIRVSAVLHDVKEDAPEYSAAVTSYGVYVDHITGLLNRGTCANYAEYIIGILESGLRSAMIVKLCDLDCNIAATETELKDPGLNRITRHIIGQRVDKYRLARYMLKRELETSGFEVPRTGKAIINP